MNARQSGLLAVTLLALAASATAWAHGSEGAYAQNGGSYGSGSSSSSSSGSGGASYAGDGGDATEADAEKDVGHFAVLSGGNEISADGKANAGADEGRGSVTVFVDPEGSQICFGLAVDDIDAPTAAHIHKGLAGSNGPIVVTLTAPSGGEPGAASGCIRDVDAQLLWAIHNKPWAYYVNVHTAKYPDGAIRGQLF